MHPLSQVLHTFPMSAVPEGQAVRQDPLKYLYPVIQLTQARGVQVRQYPNSPLHYLHEPEAAAVVSGHTETQVPLNRLNDVRQAVHRGVQVEHSAGQSMQAELLEYVLDGQVVTQICL